MATPEEIHSITATVASGDYRIDSLLSVYKWDGPVGTPAALTFSFPTANSVWTVADYQEFREPLNPRYAPFSPEQANAVRHIFQQYAEVANLKFTEIAETSTSVGDIRFAWTGPEHGGGGWTYIPWPSAVAGDVWFNVLVPLRGVNQGDSGYQPLLHEIGHALGLEHPFGRSTALPPAENNVRYTVMSYTGFPPVASPMLYDMLALQYLYGANMSTRTGNDVYSVESGYFPMTIWDAGGNDTIRAPSLAGYESLYNSYRGATIDLRDGRFSEFPVYEKSGTITSIGYLSWAIAYNAVIENAVGTNDGDQLTGNAQANLLTGSAGNDTLDGGSGADTAAFSGNRAAYTISGGGTAVSGPDGNDSLASIERLQFSDKKVALDLAAGQAGGNTARIIGALFDAPAIKQHPEWVGAGLSLFDSGMSMQAVCELVAPFKGLSNANFVTSVYTNVVGAPPAQAQLDQFVGLLRGGGGTMTQGELLALAANAAVNATNIDLVGLQQSGVEFV